MISTNSFNIYNASAGTGKTFSLVRDYLCLLLNSNNYELYKNILAITFTNKAVNEMKGRIVKYLGQPKSQYHCLCRDGAYKQRGCPLPSRSSV